MASKKRSGFLSSIGGAFRALGRFFADFGRAVAKGDFFVKLTLLWWGAGYARRRQIVKAIIATLLQAGVIAFTVLFAAKYLAKFGTLGTVVAQQYFDVELFTNVWNDYDHSFKILLYSVLSIIVLAVTFVLWIQNVAHAYRLQLDDEAGLPIPTFRQDVARYRDEKFHVTLLAAPITGIVVFTIVPLIVMIAIAFTNYDQQHMPPANLFTWVEWANFRALFTNSVTVTFGYAFRKILGWTLTWAVLATATCYIGGILVALLINSKRTRCKKLWRTGFIIAMAVPQFVSLLIVRNFFADQGIVNTLMANTDLAALPRLIAQIFDPDVMIAPLSVTQLLKNVGLVPMHMTYIPFLSHPGWTKFMIIMINIWIGVPYLLLIATGILMNIPQDLYESARIDGANAFQQFTHITMPYMLFVTAPYLINSVVQNINNFNVIYLLTQDIYTTTDQLMANSNAKEIDLLVTWLFRLTNEYYNYKMAAVIGIMVFVICAVITLIAFNLVIKGNREENFQ